mmetsp:Transcript_10339/g.29644  ORF Transcript_10339/g.29644 Transcript_10339/m.29644 type:complete len:285 (-) Transcript_10339:845-1699(-)
MPLMPPTATGMGGKAKTSPPSSEGGSGIPSYGSQMDGKYLTVKRGKKKRCVKFSSTFSSFSPSEDDGKRVGLLRGVGYLNVTSCSPVELSNAVTVASRHKPRVGTRISINFPTASLPMLAPFDLRISLTSILDPARLAVSSHFESSSTNFSTGIISCKFTSVIGVGCSGACGGFGFLISARFVFFIPSIFAFSSSVFNEGSASDSSSFFNFSWAFIIFSSWISSCCSAYCLLCTWNVSCANAYPCFAFSYASSCSKTARSRCSLSFLNFSSLIFVYTLRPPLHK